MTHVANEGFRPAATRVSPQVHGPRKRSFARGTYIAASVLVQVLAQVRIRFTLFSALTTCMYTHDGAFLRSPGSTSILFEPPLLFFINRVACGEDGPDWSILQPIAGATVECPRIAPRRNGIRWETTRRDGRVFRLRSTISLTNRRVVGTASLNEMTRNEGAGLLYRQRCRALHAERKALIG